MRRNKPAVEALDISVADDPVDLQVFERGVEEVERLLIGKLRVWLERADCVVGRIEAGAGHETTDLETFLKFRREPDVREVGVQKGSDTAERLQVAALALAPLLAEELRSCGCIQGRCEIAISGDQVDLR